MSLVLFQNFVQTDHRTRRLPVHKLKMSLFNPKDPNTDKSHTLETPNQPLKVDPPTPDSALKADLTAKPEHPRDSQINTPDQTVASKSKELPPHSPHGDTA